MNKLLPCPFCGGTRLAFSKSECSWHEPPEAYAVSCCTPECHGNIFSLSLDYFKTKDEARIAWNKRANPVRK